MPSKELPYDDERIANIYEYLVDEEDARVCKDISDSACRVVPGNFFLILLTNFLTKLGDALVDAKTVLPWLLSALGAPAAFIGLLVPIRESGSLLPQLFIAGYIRQLAVRKWVWVTGSVLQACAVFSMALIAWHLNGLTAGLALIGALIIFSLARGLCSVASKDVLGKTIPKTRRGRLTGFSASAAGVITVFTGIALLIAGRQQNQAPFLILLFAGGVLWLIAALSYAAVRESGGETDGGGNAITEGLKRLSLLKTDIPFRNFLLTRTFLLSSALSAPYYVALARKHSENIDLLGMFVLAGGAAALISAPVWGRLADRSSRQVMIITALFTAMLGLAVYLLDWLWPDAPVWIFAVAFFLLAVTHSGVRLGRKTYVVDLASGNKRTDYVAVGNTLIGVMLILAGGLSLLAELMPLRVMVLLLAFFALVAAYIAVRLPETD